MNFFSLFLFKRDSSLDFLGEMEAMEVLEFLEFLEAFGEVKERLHCEHAQ